MRAYTIDFQQVYFSSLKTYISINIKSCGASTSDGIEVACQVRSNHAGSDRPLEDITKSDRPSLLTEVEAPPD